MKKFLKSIIIFVTLIIILVCGCYFFNRCLIFKSDILTLNQNIHKIVIGASRTACGINDTYVDGTMNISSNGDALFYSMIKLRTTVKENPQIDTVILCLDNRTLDTEISKDFLRSSMSLKIRIPRYCSYFTMNEIKHLYNINKTVSIGSIFEIPKYSLKLLKSIVLNKNKNITKLGIGGNCIVEKRIKQKQINEFHDLKDSDKYRFSSDEIEKLFEIKQFCKVNNIELLFINPPFHPLVSHSSSYNERRILFESFFKKYFADYIYLDFSKEILPDDCYADFYHLNSKGAVRFSKECNSVLNELSASRLTYAQNNAIFRFY